MLNKVLSTSFSPEGDKSLSGWDQAISQAKNRIKEIKRSITRFESLRAQGMEFPKPKAAKARRRTSGSTL